MFGNLIDVPLMKLKQEKVSEIRMTRPHRSGRCVNDYSNMAENRSMHDKNFILRLTNY